VDFAHACGIVKEQLALFILKVCRTSKCGGSSLASDGKEGYKDSSKLLVLLQRYCSILSLVFSEGNLYRMS